MLWNHLKKNAKRSVPKYMATNVDLVQESILGIIKCKQRALEVLFWPAMNSDNEEPVKNCTKCADFQRKQLSGALLPTETPKLPFEMVGTDLFEFESKTYFLTVYNYSKFIEVERLLALERKAIKNVPNSADMAYLKKYKVMGVHGSLLRILQDSALTMALPIRLRTPPLRWPMVRPKEHCRQKVSLEKSR